MDPAEERSLDLVQRVVFSAIVVVVIGSISATLAGYVALNTDEFSRVDGTILWVMTGIIGLVTVMIVLAINRRSLISALARSRAGTHGHLGLLGPGRRVTASSHLPLRGSGRVQLTRDALNR